MKPSNTLLKLTDINLGIPIPDDHWPWHWISVEAEAVVARWSRLIFKTNKTILTSLMVYIALFSRAVEVSMYITVYTSLAYLFI